MAYLKPYQITQANDIAGLVKTENLAYQFGIDPQKASKVPIKLKEVNFGVDMDVYLSKYPTKTFDTADDFTWDIETAGDKNIPLVKATLSGSLGATAVAAGDKPGLGGSEFYMFFEQAWFFDTNQIVGEELEDYPILIKDEPIAVGDLWMYRVQLVAQTDEDYIPVEELAAGKRFSIDFSPVEHTMSVKGGGIHHDFPYTMRNSMTMMRMEDLVPGDMIERPTKFYWKNKKTGKYMSSWMDKRTYDFEMEYLKQKNYMLMYSRSNMRADGSYRDTGKSGNILKQGAGLKEQIRRANYYTFNEFNIESLTNMLLEMSVGKYNQSQRSVTLSTGEWGMVEFHKDLERLSTLYTPSRETSRIMSKGSRMSYQGQFFEYKGPNGVNVSIIHDPTKDDSVRNKKYHPTKPGLIESYNYDIMNMGTSSGEANIQKCTIKRFGEIRKWREGLRSPYDYGEGSMQTKVDAWEETRAYTGGVMVMNPERTGTYELNI